MHQRNKVGASGCVAVIQQTNSDLKCNPQLMAWRFAVDVEQCPKCQCRMKLVALVQ